MSLDPSSGAGFRYPRTFRLLEILPGAVTWLLIVAPVVLSVWYPVLVAWFVLTFDFYWLYKAVVLIVSVSITFLRVRDVQDADWAAQLDGLRDLSRREHVLEERIARIVERVRELERGGRRLAARGGRRERHRFEGELVTVRRLLASGIQPLDPRRLVQVALIPTYTEPYEKLEATVRALAEADWPLERKIVAIITRETDLDGRANVARLREVFGDRFAHFFHILDPLEPGVVVGKSSAMAYGGRWLYGKLVGLGYDPGFVIVTDLDSDYRVHRQYFTYLAHRFATDPERYHRLYQPIPMFHNNLWEVPLAVRLTAVSATHVQMWRSLTPERLISFSSYAVSLRTIHEVGYWATDAIPEDSRFYWKSFFTYAGTFRAEPLFIPIFGDAVRARTYPRTLYQQYTQIRRWAWGVTDIPYYIHQALSHPEIPLRVRVHRLVDLWSDHINWAIAPYVLLFGSSLPLFISQQTVIPWAHSGFAETTLGHNLPVYAAWMLTGAFCCLLILIFIEDRIAPPRPESWGILRRALVYVQWLAVPAVGMIFSNLPALDAQTRLMTGRRLEYTVTEKA
ncbi:MAG: glycosyltransferase family 2 protein [Chloroflexi bacterium]|nr:glycosyltransferase family 2 protein [Chloroflexota bacterium]